MWGQQRPGGMGAAGGGAPAAGTAARGNNNNDTQLPEGPSGIISSVRWSPPNCANLMVSATSWDKSVRVWGVQTQNGANGLVTAMQAQPIGIQNSEMPILSSDFAKDGRCFYGGCDRGAYMWDLQSGQTQQVAAHDMPICCVRYQEDGAAAPMLVTSGWDAKVRFWDLRSPTPAKEESFGAPVHHMDLSTAPLATFLCGRKCVVYNLQTMQKSHDAEPVAKASYAMRRVANLKDQSQVFACTVDGRIANLALSPQQVPDQFKAHGGADPRNAKLFDAYQMNFLCAHPTNKTLISGASDGLIRCFDISQRGRFFEFEPRLFNNQPIPVSAGDLSADGMMLAYGLSYDWSLGKDGFNAQAPQGVFLKALQAEHVR
jgi:mRNA export factor